MNVSILPIAEAQTFLFVPGDRPDRFDKALASNTDCIILDLEDAVAPDAKDRARAAVRAYLAPERRVIVRINAVGTSWFADDLALAALPGIGAVMLAKAEQGDALTRIAATVPTIALVETAAGLNDLSQIAQTPGIFRMALGEIDLALDLDLLDLDRLAPARFAMVVASRAARIAAPIAGVTTDFKDATIAEADAREAREIGFGGKLCIHPAQIAPVLRAFAPSPEELERARRIVQASRDHPAGTAFSLGGRMVDLPVISRARRMLQAAGDEVDQGLGQAGSRRSA